MAPRILIVDDHEIVRRGVRAILTEFRPEWQICGEAADAHQALPAVANLCPDVMILDITMPGTSGLELASSIRQQGHSCRILIFTMHDSARLAGDVQAGGAQGYVLKSQAAQDLVLAIETLLGGGTFFGCRNQSGAPSDSGPSPHALFFGRLSSSGISTE